MKVVILLACAGAGFWRTSQEIPRWRSDQALWTAAVAIDPTPRALVNLGAAYVNAGFYGPALQEARRALDAKTEGSEQRSVRRMVSRQLRWINLTQPVCDTPRWEAACSP